MAERAFEDAMLHGRPSVDFAELEAWFADHPAEASMFDEAMASHAAAIVPAVLGCIDLNGCRVIADIGGGSGHVLTAILGRHPDLRGFLFDLPHVVDRAEAPLPNRMHPVAGDFFSDTLPEADTYLLMCVVHDWADDDAKRLLSNVRAAAKPGARLIVIENVLSDEPGPDYAKSLDVLMLAVAGGRERTATEYRQLLAATSFQVRSMANTSAGYSVIDAIAI